MHSHMYNYADLQKYHGMHSLICMHNTEHIVILILINISPFLTSAADVLLSWCLRSASNIRVTILGSLFIIYDSSLKLWHPMLWLLAYVSFFVHLNWNLEFRPVTNWPQSSRADNCLIASVIHAGKSCWCYSHNQSWSTNCSRLNVKQQS